MADSSIKKIQGAIQNAIKEHGKFERQAFLPPPVSADAAAALVVSRRNSEIVAGAVLGLHGPPQEGVEAAQRVMSICVDWNEVRVANPSFLIKRVGRDKRGEERIALLQKFLEAFFLRQRNLNLDILVNLKPAERRQFISNLEVFSRDELAAVLLTCFGHQVFPPSEELLAAAIELGMVSDKTTGLQMAKKFETGLNEEELVNLYAYLALVASQPRQKKGGKDED